VSNIAFIVNTKKKKKKKKKIGVRGTGGGGGRRKNVGVEEVGENGTEPDLQSDVV